MKTTVHIADALLADVQKIAAKRKTTLKALVDEGLRHVVAKEGETKKPFKLKDGSVGVKGGPWPLEGQSWEDIVDLVYEGRNG